MHSQLFESEWGIWAALPRNDCGRCKALHRPKSKLPCFNLRVGLAGVRRLPKVTVSRVRRMHSEGATRPQWAEVTPPRFGCLLGTRTRCCTPDRPAVRVQFSAQRYCGLPSGVSPMPNGAVWYLPHLAVKGISLPHAATGLQGSELQESNPPRGCCYQSGLSLMPMAKAMSKYF